MKFFNKSEESLYSSMDDLKDGCYPITNNGIWHSGIHVYFPVENNEIVKNPIAGCVVASNFNENKDWNYIVVENDIEFPCKKKGKTQGFHCYNLIGNLMNKMPYDDLIEKDNQFETTVLNKLKDIPFYIKLKTKLPENNCQDNDNYTIFNINLTRNNSNPAYDPEIHSGYDNLSAISKTDTALKDSLLKTRGKQIGNLKYDIGVDSRDFVDNAQDFSVEIKGKNITLNENLPTGYVIRGDKQINSYGNIKYEKNETIYFWKEKDVDINSYPGFGLVVNKKFDVWKKVLELLSEERKTELKAILESNTEKEAYVYIVVKDENIFPFINEKTCKGKVYKIKGPNGEIVHKFQLNSNEYKLIKSELVGFFKNKNIYYSAGELWTEIGLTYDIMEKTDISSEYGNFFNAVKVIDVNNKPVTSYTKNTKLDSNFFCKAQLHCFEETAYTVEISPDSIYKKMIYISDPYALYAFKDTEILDGFPCSEKTGIPDSDFEFTNAEEVLKNISEKKNYIWLRNDKMQVYVHKNVYEKLRIKVVKDNVKKGRYVGVGEKLGFPFWKEAPKENEMPASMPYIDYALFFTKDITSQNNTLEKIEIKEDEKCFVESKTYSEDTDKIFLPPHAEVSYKKIENNKDCILLESVKYKAYVYPGWISNKKIKDNSANILFYSSQCKVEIRNDEIITITPNFTEEQKSLIKSIVDEIFPLMKTNQMEALTISGDLVYRYTYEKKYNVFVENNIEVSNSCKFLKTYKENVSYIEDKVPKGGYTEIMPTTSIEDIVINGEVCNGFVINSKLYYVPKQVVDNSRTNVLSEIMENAKVLNFGKNAIASTNVCPDGELLIVEESGKENVRELRKLLRADIEKENKDLLDYVHTDREDYGFKIFDEEKLYSELLKGYMHKIISKHPLEFDFEKIKNEKVCKKRGLPPIDESKESDVFAGLKNADSSLFSKNSFYFACAPYFYNKMEELGLMFLNPYQGVSCYSRLGGKKDPLYEFKINPGFAPCCEEKGLNGKFIYERNINGKTWYFATLNNPYGYSNGYFGKTKNHTGIDFPGTNDENIKNAPIMALVRCRIWACTTGNGSVRDSDSNGSYGRCMIIKGDNDYLYILGHLQDFAGHKAGDYISPGEIVAHAGNTGFSDAQHLHLELIECKTGMGDKARDSVLNMTYNQLHESDGGEIGSKNSYLKFDDSENKYFASKMNKGHGPWNENRLDPLTGEKK